MVISLKSKVLNLKSHVSPFKLPNQPFVLFPYRNGLMGGAVEAGENAEAGGFHGVGLEVAQPLNHFQTLIPDFHDFGFADDLVVEFHGRGEVKFYMHQNQVDGGPINLVLVHFFQIKTPSKVKIMALVAVIDVDEGV